jgi:TonB-dependent receptor
MINSAYVGLDYQFSESFSGNFGLRAEQINLLIDYNVQGGFNGDGSQSYNPFYILPSTNLKYNLTDKNTFRLGLSKTYTFPQSIELSPYQLDWDGFKIQGNPDLKPAVNYNIDLKWDYYLSPSELISFTGFYKYINNPIARVNAANSGGYLTYDNISNRATVAGVEMEIRKNIINKVNSNIEKVNKLTAGLNASYIYSNMLIKVGSDLPRYSALEGAAPYIANFDLTYEYSNKSVSLVNSLVLNYISDKIFTIGFGGFIDIIEKGKPTLDFVSSYKINKHINLKLKAKNILDPTYELTRKATDGSANKTLRSYKKGMDISLGFSYNF